MWCRFPFQICLHFLFSLLHWLFQQRGRRIMLPEWSPLSPWQSIFLCLKVFWSGLFFQISFSRRLPGRLRPSVAHSQPRNLVNFQRCKDVLIQTFHGLLASFNYLSCNSCKFYSMFFAPFGFHYFFSPNI